MNRVTDRRLRSIEQTADVVITERERGEAKIDARARQAARDHAARLVALILYGNPQKDIPLERAWRRARETLELSDCPENLIPDRLRALVLPKLPGTSENAKFAHVFRSAPEWLLSFCFCSMDANLLGFDLPPNAEPRTEPGCEGLEEIFRSWPCLPYGTLEAGGPIPEMDLSPLDDEPNIYGSLDPYELIDLAEINMKDKKHWSHKDRRRRKEIMVKMFENCLRPTNRLKEK